MVVHFSLGTGIGAMRRTVMPWTLVLGPNKD
jgi:hypothetical protein